VAAGAGGDGVAVEKEFSISGYNSRIEVTLL
jgi:hypothetical protein